MDHSISRGPFAPENTANAEFADAFNYYANRADQELAHDQAIHMGRTPAGPSPVNEIPYGMFEDSSDVTKDYSADNQNGYIW